VIQYRVEPPVPRGGDMRLDLCGIAWFRLRSVALAGSRLPHSRAKPLLLQRLAWCGWLV